MNQDLPSSQNDHDEQDSPVRTGEILLREQQESKPVRVLKPVTLSPYKPRRVNPDVVTFDFYDAFNYSILSGEQRNVRLTLGVTSANPNEGKTLVASNLAVSLALAHEKKTVIVDLNVRKPKIHSVFGTPAGPGLVEALKGGDVTVWPTQIEHLFVLPAGGTNGGTHQGEAGAPRELRRPARKSPMRLNQLAEFRDVLYSLEQEYEFIIVDVPAINGREFPILYAGQLEGLVVVVNTVQTKKKDLEKMFRVINEKQVLGFVFNRVKEGD